MNPLLDGVVHCHGLDGWRISWESRGPYRHWCLQEPGRGRTSLLVLMFNPGSLSRDGQDLKRDTTLRVLRDVFGASEFNPFIVNLYDYAATSPADLFANWQRKDSHHLVFEFLNQNQFAGVLYAYGDYEHGPQRGPEIRDRISLVKSIFKQLPEVSFPKNKSGTPKHPLSWQREKIKPEITRTLRSFENQDRSRQVV